MPISATRSGSEPRLAALVGRALVLLLLGFALERSGAGRWASDGIAAALARLSAFGLAPFGLDLIRDGVELRSASGGWAVRVSEVCDGLGLIVALCAALIAGQPTAPHRARPTLAARILIGTAAIMVFNLLRVMVLALVLAHAPAAFGPMHGLVFPFLTLVLLCALVLPWRRVLAFAALTLVLAALWHGVADAVALRLVGPANLVLALMPPPGFGALAATPQGITIVETTFIAGLDPVRLYSVPIRPADFILALPMVLAAALITRRYAALVLSLVTMGLALVCGALTAMWDFAQAKGPLQYLVPDGTGAFLAAALPPPGMLWPVTAIVQNTLVHFNLLVLPILMLAAWRQRNA